MLVIATRAGRTNLQAEPSWFRRLRSATRAAAQASSASFVASTRYGISILWLLLQYRLHRSGILHQRRFDSLERRYRNAAEINSTGK